MEGPFVFEVAMCWLFDEVQTAAISLSSIWSDSYSQTTTKRSEM